MKTFTNYAEKKAKQFLNLLQGYTKGIRITAILILLLMGVSNAWAGNDFTQGVVVYFDNTETQWSSIYLRVGHSTYSSAYQVTSKVSGTDALYKYTLPSWGGYDAFSFANKSGRTGNYTIYQPSNYQYNSNYPSGQTTYFSGWNLDKRRLFIPKSVSNTDKGCTYYNTDIEYDNYQRTVTITSPTNGSITVTYKDESDASQSKNSGNFKVAQTCIITVSATPSAGYELKSLKIGGSSHTSGNTYIVRGDVTIEATFSAKTYTVTLNNQDATTAGATSVTATYGSGMPSIANNLPKKTGYNFKGYYDATTGGNQYYKADGTSAKNWNKTSATTLYAQWDLVTYNITYNDLKGATHTNPVTYTINSATITFTAPTSKPAGYTFANWSPASIATGSTGNKTVTANWTAATSPVELNQEEATEKGTASVTATYGSAMPAITKLPIRTGYTFGGYYTGKDGAGTQYYKADGTSVTTWALEGAQTLYAKWEIINYTIIYNNLNGVTHNNPTTYTVETPTITFSNPTSTREGYTFNGWDPASIAKGSTGNKTVTAQWTVNQYNLTWELAGGTITVEGTPAGPVNYGTQLFKPTITKEGYTHTGWSPEVPATMPAKDATYTAKWAINQYTINYGVCAESRHGNIQLGNGTEVTTTATSDKINHGTEVTFTATPESKDYKIEGWYSDANCANKIQAAGTNSEYTFTLTGETTVYVKFAEADEQMSNVNISATTGGTVSPNGSQQVGNKTRSVIKATPNPGYKFSGWTYTNGVTVVSQNITDQQGSITITASEAGNLIANFVRVYTVTYYNTFNTAGTVSASASGANVESGDAFEENTIITFVATPNTQCNFIKWIDGAGRLLSTEATYNHTVVDDITVKAVFTINQYTLTFTAGDGGHVSATVNNSEVASPATLDYNTSVTLTATPSANCMFLGWYDGNTQKSPSAVYTTTLTADKNLEARFKKGTTIFFKPVDYWKEADARFAVYTWGGSAGDKWIEFEDYGCNEDIFTADIPAGYTGFKIVRLKPASADDYNSEGDGFNWNNRWAETVNLTIPTGDKNLYDMTVTKASTKLYFTPHGNWKEADARFAAYFFGNGNKWVDLTHHNDGIYACDKPSGYTKVIFGRMNPGTKDNNFNDGVKWNQTGDIVIPTNGPNHYILTGGEWNDVTGEWHTAWDDRQWTTYAAPSYKLTIKSTANGTVAVSKVGGGALANNETIKLGDEITITFTPEEGYELSNYLINYASETEADGVYTVCGPTKIIAEFDLIAPSRTVYLRPNEDWLRDNPIMAAYAYKSTDDKAYRWYVMNTTDDDYTGAYSCKIPSEYDKIIFVRLNPNGSSTTNDGFNWDNKWNQTKALTIIDKDNDATNDKKMRFAIGNKIETDGEDYGRYDGKWEENTPIWGLIANFNDWTAEKAIFMGYPGKLNVKPPFVSQHAFKLFNFFYAENSNYFGNSGTMQRENSEQWWTMDANEQANCQMKLDAKGDYIYQLRFLTVGPELRKQISVTYPNAEDVYYLMYKDNENKQRISYAITIADNRLDTISFFVDANKDPYIYLLDQNKNIVGEGYRIVATGEDDPGSAMLPGKRKAGELVIGDGCGVKTSGVYNFVVTQENGNKTFEPTLTHAYKGNYYVRTDAATGGWNAYKQAGNKMTYSSYADKNHNFDHYYCKWVESPEPKNGSNQTNVKFCVANDYSHALSDELNGDEIIEKTGVATGCLPDSVNVRFAWDSKTNELSRAYISGSAYAKDRFLVLTGNEYLLYVNGDAIPKGTDADNRLGLNAHELLFSDKQNWIYQLDVQANSNTDITLTALFNEKVQTFFGTAKSNGGSTPMMQATNDTYHKVRMIYDFKTNNLIAAWLLDPEQEIEAESVASNMLIIREDQGTANQITFTNNNNKTDIQTAYGVMTFTKAHITNKEKSARERSLYWISFPFDVKIDDVFGLGIGEYADQWIIQRYNGAARAEKGLFIDSGTYWEYIFDKETVLNAGEGYVLVLDLEKVDFLHGATDVSLYFPSLNSTNTLIGALPTEFTVPEHWCNIDREWTEDGKTYYHQYTDSHWNLIGVPGFADTSWSEERIQQYKFIEEDASFYYNFNLKDSKYYVESSATTFKVMYAYMVQFAGNINWSTQKVEPAQKALAARRNVDAALDKVVLRLELAQGKELADRTFIQLEEEGATAEFDLSRDLTKIINSGANIYTLAGEYSIQTAGNALPMEEAVVPVGVDIATAGEYTFRMPDGTEGMVVELLDYEANTRTNLLLSDYTVTLQKGSNENRFALYIQPSKSGVSTSIENVDEGVNGGEAVMKYLIDGKLFIRTADGVLYDAQGRKL